MHLNSTNVQLCQAYPVCLCGDVFMWLSEEQWSLFSSQVGLLLFGFFGPDMMCRERGGYGAEEGGCLVFSARLLALLTMLVS